MNKFQTRPAVTLVQRVMPVTELRPGSTVSLGLLSRATRKLPSSTPLCAPGLRQKVLSVEPFGFDAVKVKLSPGDSRRPEVYIVPGNQVVVAMVPEVEPVPHTPLGWAVMMGVPGALQVAAGTRYAA